MNTREYLTKLQSYRIRRCRWMHECCLCGDKIRDGELYHDGGYGKRAHESCVTRGIEESRPVFTHCNVCGHALYGEAELAVGACSACLEQ